MKQWLRHHAPGGVGGLIAGGVLGALMTAGVAYAATGALTSSPSSPAQACVLPGGIVRVIQPTEQCRRFEKPISLGGVGAPEPSTPSVLTGRINGSASGNEYFGAVSGISNGTSDRSIQTRSPASATTAQNLSVRLPAPVTDPTFVVIEIPGQPLGLRCQVMPGQDTCTNTTDHVPVAPGSVLDVNVFSVVHAPTSVAFGFELAHPPSLQRGDPDQPSARH